MAAAAAGGVIAAPSAAHAFPGVPDRWEDVVACESSGDPNAVNSSSGAGGYYQIIPSTWHAYGGGEFASSAAAASPREQLIVAERVLAGQGADAWVCGGAPGTPTSVQPPDTAHSHSHTHTSSSSSAVGGGEYREDIRQGYDGTCDRGDLYWDSCDPANLGAGPGSAAVHSGGGDVLYRVAGVAIKDLDGDGDGDPVRCGPPALRMFERCD